MSLIRQRQTDESSLLGPDFARWLFATATLGITAGAPVLTAVGVWIAFVVIDVDASLRYFEITAQIIPVLVLALAIEQRHFFHDRPPPLPSPIRQRLPKRFAELEIQIVAVIYSLQAFIVLVLIGAEGAALWAVAATEPTPEIFAASTAGLATGAIALLVTPVALAVKAWLDEQVEVLSEVE